MNTIKQPLARPCVAIPVYKEVLTEAEIRSLKQAAVIFSDTPTYLVCSPKLKIELYTQHFPLLKIKTFDASYFDSIEGYNRLMTSREFYSSFSSYTHLLIYQLDAYVFSNKLIEWSEKPYSYIGAPWLYYELSSIRQLHCVLPIWHRMRILKPFRSIFSQKHLVGNGGFSLRFIPIFESLSDTIENDFELNKLRSRLNEDIIWSIVAPEIDANFKVAPWKEALQFSFEVNSEIAFQLNKYQLPFGCHAWEKHGYTTFWNKFIK